MIEREQKIKTLAHELANGDRDIDHTFQQLDTVWFPLILANMFHCYIPNNKVYKYSTFL